MKKKNLRLFLLALPMFALFITSSCADDAASEEKEPVEEEKPLEPLMDREPEVKEYFRIMNELIDEYLDAGETLLNTIEKMDAGDLDLLESTLAIQELLVSWEEVDLLNESLAQQGSIKENIEANLNAKDILEFKEMYTESLQRMEALANRLDDIDLSKYLE